MKISIEKYMRKSAPTLPRMTFTALKADEGY